MCGVWLRSFRACQHAHQLETGNTSDPTWSYRVVLQTVVWAMVSRQVTIVGSGMRRIDDPCRHLWRDVHGRREDASLPQSLHGNTTLGGEDRLWTMCYSLS